MVVSNEEFDALVTQEWLAVPESVKNQLENLVLLIEDEPSEQVRTQEHLEEGDTLLGLYQGIPRTERGSQYGVGITMPDSITLYRIPIQEEALEFAPTIDAVRHVVRETIWHEVGHCLGLTEAEVHAREESGSNQYRN